MTSPVLSLVMPTRNRPELLERALRSLVTAMAPVAEHVEVTVSDGSDTDASGRVVERLLTDWPGGHTYVWNRPALTMIENMNPAAELASGEWVQQFDDDDLMLPMSGQLMIDSLRRVPPREQVVVFGAHIVDVDGVKRREQTFEREQYLPPGAALRRLLRNSSFVREPMVVVRRTALAEAGMFDPEVGDAADTDMWVRLFSRYGARCLPVATCAYTIHEAAATMGMWNPRTIDVLDGIFDRAVATGVVPEREVRRWEADFMHQFILAGAYRRLRERAVRRRQGRAAAVPAPDGQGARPVAQVAAGPARVHDRGRHPAPDDLASLADEGGAPQVLSDVRELDNDQQVEVDVCIVGAGPAGITIARELIGDDAEVWLLESGGRDAERRAQRLNRGQSVGHPIHRPHQSRVRAFGGTSRHWFRPGDDSWAARPLDPIDFEVRPGIRYSGWPFDRAHLEPVLRPGPGGVPARPVRLRRRIAGPTRNGRRPCHSPRARSRPRCSSTASTTSTGYYEELVRAPNVTLLLHASVVDLATDGDPGRVDRVELRREDGSRCFVRARLVVLAAGGIENPRLLLLSRRVHRDGLGNDHDLVGRFFAERMSARTGYILPASPELIGRAGLYAVHEPAPGVRVQGALRVTRRRAAGTAAPQLRVLPAAPEPLHDDRGRPVGRDPGQGPAPPPAARGDRRSPPQRRHRPRGPRRLRPRSPAHGPRRPRRPRSARPGRAGSRPGLPGDPRHPARPVRPARRSGRLASGRLGPRLDPSVAGSHRRGVAGGGARPCRAHAG